MKKETDINIDALLRDTFLTVVELRQGTTVRHGMELYRHCQRQVELVRERLKDAGFSRESVEHITYAPVSYTHLLPLTRRFRHHLLQRMRNRNKAKSGGHHRRRAKS